MKGGKCVCLLAASLILLPLAPRRAPAQAPGSSPGSAAAVGQPLTDIVECGEGYTSHELYDMTLTVLEVVRGEDAWKRLAAAGPSNRPAAAGSEYLLARIRFEYRARTLPGLCVHRLTPDKFTLYSADGEDYPQAPAAPPAPELRAEMKSGDAFEGWVVFMVARQDRAPLMSYTAGSGGAVRHGVPKWFVLK